MRDYIGDHISIDGRMITYRLVTAFDYLQAKYGWSNDEIEEFCEKNYKVYRLINQIMALKQSCFLMQRVSYSCGSLSNHLYDLKEKLIIELDRDYGFKFDNQFVEDYQ